MAKHEYTIGNANDLKVKIFSDAFSANDDLSDFEKKINKWLNDKKNDNEIVSVETSHNYNGDNHRARRSVLVTILYKPKGE